MLRKAKLSDFSFVYELYMHSQTNPYLLYEEMSLIEFEPIFEELVVDKEAIFIYYADNQAIGMCKLLPNEYRLAHGVYLGGVAIHPDYMGKGHGKQMMKEIIAYCTSQGFIRIELSARIDNEKAVKLYESVGFQKEGVLKKYGFFQKENRYIDEVLMAYIC
jgi:putative acetyltransferase